MNITIMYKITVSSLLTLARIDKHKLGSYKDIERKVG